MARLPPPQQPGPGCNTIAQNVIPESVIPTNITTKGQVTIPKKVRDALRLAPGDGVEFNVNREGQVVVLKAAARRSHARNRFTAALGKAQVKWRTDELMALLRD